MAKKHVVTALVKKKTEIEKPINIYKEILEQLQLDLEHLNHTVKHKQHLI